MKLNPFARADTGEHPQLRAYHQLYALYEGLPDRLLADPENRRAVAALEEIRKQAEEKLKAPGEEGREFISAELQRMEAALVRLLPPEDLVPRLDIYRDEFHNLCTEENFTAYQASSTFKNSTKAVEDPALTRFLRADALYLLSQLQRYNSLHQRAETSRTELLGHLARFTLVTIAALLVPVLLFLGDRLDGKPAHFLGVLVAESDAVKHVAGIALLAFCAVAGVTGAFVSATNRIQRLSVSRELARNAVVLKNTAAQLKWVPITGIVSALLFSLFVWSGLLQGDFFPKPFATGTGDAGGKAIHLTDMLLSAEFAKLMVWCFVAGFSERLVPDMLDRIIPRAAAGVTPPAAPGQQQQEPQGDAAARPAVVDTSTLRAVVAADAAAEAPAREPAASTDAVESDVVETEAAAPDDAMPGEQPASDDTPDPDVPTADIEIGLVDTSADQPEAGKTEQPAG